MKTKLIQLIAVACLMAWTATGAFAASSTANLSVTATVGANCTISTSAVAFGSYDPVSANASSALDGVGGVTVTCTNGSAATITLGQGGNAATGSSDAAPLRRMKDSGSDYLSYSLFSDSSRTTIWGNTAATAVNHTGTGSAASLSVYGQVAGAQNVPAGSYSDTVVATVTF